MRGVSELTTSSSVSQSQTATIHSGGFQQEPPYRRQQQNKKILVPRSTYLLNRALCKSLPWPRNRFCTGNPCQQQHRRNTTTPNKEKNKNHSVAKSGYTMFCSGHSHLLPRPSGTVPYCHGRNTPPLRTHRLGVQLL